MGKDNISDGERELELESFLVNIILIFNIFILGFVRVKSLFYPHYFNTHMSPMVNVNVDVTKNRPWVLCRY